MVDIKDVKERFQNKKILVIGDVMLDEYVYGDITRISPEAPVSIHDEDIFKKPEYKSGGAGNVASNLYSLQGKSGEVYLFGFIGKDKEGEILKTILKNEEILQSLNEDSVTSVKTRYIAKNGQCVFRSDREDKSEKTFLGSSRLILLDRAKEADMIVISDYAKGCINLDLISLLKNYKEKIIVDPKPKYRDTRPLYQGVNLITPNEKEAIEMSGETDISKAGQKLREIYNSNIMITLGENGIFLFPKTGEPEHIRTKPEKDVIDPAGAGDTAISAITLALASGYSLNQAAKIGNYAARIVVNKRGVYVPTFEELIKTINQNGI